MTAGLPLMKNVLMPLTKNVLLPFGLSAGTSAPDVAIQRNFFFLLIGIHTMQG